MKNLSMKKVNNIIRHYLYNTKHKLLVAMYLIRVSYKLLIRALLHDISKYFIVETKLFSETIDNLKYIEYGSKEYEHYLKELESALKHHYRLNKHHPEHYCDGIADMDLVSIIEMLCDWKASCKRNETGHLIRSIEINRKRFKFSKELCKILKNSSI